MPPARDLSKLPPLPVVGLTKRNDDLSSKLLPIPELSTRTDSKENNLPRVMPPPAAAKPQTNKKPGQLTAKSSVRKVASPFKSRETQGTKTQSKPKSPITPLSPPVKSIPLPNGPPRVVKMQPPETPIPNQPVATAKRKESITGPVRTRPEPLPVVPPEIMLRNSIRRTISEHDSSASPFRDVSALERFKWILQALFSSRTYDDIAFEKTRRFRVEEVYLLRKESLTLISYASSDPIRHVYPRKIDYDLRRLRSEVSETLEKKLNSFKLPTGRRTILREGKHSLLAAVIRGSENEFFEADLDFIHSRIEHRVGRRLNDEVSNFTFPLQPALEDCLLIQSPAPPQ